MSAIYAIALLMVWIECATVAFMLHAWKLPLFMALLALVGCLGHWRFNPNWVQRRLLAIGMAVGFLLWWRFALEAAPSAYVNIAFGNNMAYAVALHFVAIQLCQLFIRHPNRLPVHFSLLGLGAMALSGDSFPHLPWVGTVYFLFSFAFAICVCLYHHLLRPWRPGESRAPVQKYVLMSSVILLSLGLAWSTAVALKWGQQRIEQLLIGVAGLSPYEMLGTSVTATLYGVQASQRRDPDRIALRLQSESPPPYLRAHAYTEYRAPRWREDSNAQVLTPSLQHPMPGERTVFALSPAAPATLVKLQVWPDPAIASALFLPPGAALLAMDAERVRLDSSGVGTSVSSTPGAPYRVYYDETHVPAVQSEPPTDPYLLVPDFMRERLQAAAAEANGDARSPRKRAAAIVQWLQAQHPYGNDFRAPDGVDPLEHFLFNAPGAAAHCEFFASAAALLLRAEGIPTRYMTGVAPWERGQLGDYWVVRNRDAHAWVEAFDPKSGWFAVEATPAAGLPNAAPEQPSAWSEFWYRLGRIRARFLATLWSGHWRGLLSLLIEVFSAFVDGLLQVWFVWVALLSGTALWILQRRTQLVARWRRRLAPLRETGDLRTMHDLLRGMDRRMARMGLQRASEETLHDFADRIEEAWPQRQDLSGWYRNYARVRYGGDRSSTALATLKSAAQKTGTDA